MSFPQSGKQVRLTVPFSPPPSPHERTIIAGIGCCTPGAKKWTILPSVSPPTVSPALLSCHVSRLAPPVSARDGLLPRLHRRRRRRLRLAGLRRRRPRVAHLHDVVREVRLLRRPHDQIAPGRAQRRGAAAPLSRAPALAGST